MGGTGKTAIAGLRLMRRALCLGVLVPSLGVAQGVRVALTPASQTVVAGSEFEQVIRVTAPGSSFNAYETILAFDPTVVAFLPASPPTLQEGPYMIGACGQTFHHFLARGDSLLITHALLCNETSLPGPGELYRLRFRARDRSATTTIRFLRARFYVDGLLVSPVVPEDAAVDIVLPRTHLEVSVVGKGMVTREPDLATYEHGSTVLLTAVSDSGHHFVGWSGDTLVDTNPLALTMDRDWSIVATFGFRVGVAVAGNGTVVRNPDKTLFAPGEQVVLTALASSGFHFAGWSGDTSEVAHELELTVYRNWELNATFLEATAVGTGLAATSSLGWPEPNPAVGRSSIRIDLPVASRIRMELIDLQGRVVARLAEGTYEAGQHRVAIEGLGRHGGPPAGVYYIRLRSTGGQVARRVVLMR